MKANDDSHYYCICDKKFLFGMCNCTVESDVGTGDFSLLLRILQVCGHAHVRSHVPPGKSCVLGIAGSLYHERVIITIKTRNHDASIVRPNEVVSQ